MQLGRVINPHPLVEQVEYLVVGVVVAVEVVAVKGVTRVDLLELV